MNTVMNVDQGQTAYEIALLTKVRLLLSETTLLTKEPYDHGLHCLSYVCITVW